MADSGELITNNGGLQLLAGGVLFPLTIPVVSLKYPLSILVAGFHLWVSKSCHLQLN